MTSSLRRVLPLILLCVATLFGGIACQSIPYTVTKRDAIDKAIATARAETETRMEGIKAQELKVLRDTIDEHSKRGQSAADYLFKGSVVYGSLKEDQISRPTLIMGQSIQQTAAQLPPATAAAQAAAFKALQTELDETKIGTAALKAQYEAELGRARAEGAAKEKALQELDTKARTLEQERTKVLQQALATEQALQTEKDKVQDKDLAKAREEEARAKSVQALKLKMSAIVGGIALLCLAGAIWSPIGKEKFAIGAAILGLASVSIWYLEAWMILTAVALSILTLIGWAAYKGYIQSRAATGVFRAIQEVKNTAKPEYERVLKPKLAEWVSVYDPKTGKPVPDKAAVEHIDQVLREAGDL
jgi:hypothetical protein